MNEQQHPITPPPELVEQWWQATMPNIETSVKDQLCTQAARWGADQELEACIEWLWKHQYDIASACIRDARRPNPPSLAKQGCDALDTYIYGNPNHKDKERTYNTIRRALERLQELESNG